MTILASFNNRTQALKFANDMRGLGVSVKIINTPREISTSCGLSVMFDSRHLFKAKAVVSASRLMSLRGFFLKKQFHHNFTYEKVN